MRTKRIKLYRWDELSEDAKQRAYQNLAGYHWQGFEPSEWQKHFLNESEFLKDGTIYTEQ
jgi:hypothetical protein